MHNIIPIRHVVYSRIGNGNWNCVFFDVGCLKENTNVATGDLASAFYVVIHDHGGDGKFLIAKVIEKLSAEVAEILAMDWAVKMGEKLR